MSSQLIISPPLSKLPEYAVRGKRLIINWEDTLQANATYQFNFGNAVVDVNEGNPNDDLIYVFSTGSYIDSLLIAGQVVNSIDNTPMAGAAVMIYKEEADSLPMTQRPDYFAMTNDEGLFKIKYLPDGDFKIFVLKEEQRNYKYNGPPEIIGFLEERIESSLNDTTDLLLIPAFLEEDTNQFISSRKETDYGYYLLVFNKPVTQPEVSFIDVETNQTLDAIQVLSPKKDSLKAWVRLPKREDLDEIAVYINDGKTLTDTTFWYIEENPKYKEKSELKVTSNITGNKLNINSLLSLNFNHPIEKIDTAHMFFTIDSIPTSLTHIEKDLNDRKLIFHYDFKPQTQYKFEAHPGAFTDFFGVTNDSIFLNFSLRDADYYGSLSVKIIAPQNNNPEVQKILQFMNDKDAVLKERIYNENFSETFKLLAPGKYKMKVIFDENGNGKWDTGIYRDKIQPEKMSIYPDEIEIRSNWELDLEWTPTTPFD